MRAIIVIASMLICGCASINETFKLSYDLPINEMRWIERTPPTSPLNLAEALAVESAGKYATIKSPGATAYYESKKDFFAIITYERLYMAEETLITTVKYRIRNGLVYGETIPISTTKQDTRKEAIAREVALNSLNGSSDYIPKLYDGRVFIAKSTPYNTCTVDVVEKDMDREYVTYRIKTC